MPEDLYDYDEHTPENAGENEVTQKSAYEPPAEPEVKSADIPAMVYTGPNIFAFALQRFQVFKGGLPPYVKRAVEKIPAIEKLIVPVSKLEYTRQRINKPGTPEARFFVAIQQAAGKVK